MFQMSFDVMKCKEYYIDCVNYHTWVLEKICTYGAGYGQFLTELKKRPEGYDVKCPIHVSPKK